MVRGSGLGFKGIQGIQLIGRVWVQKKRDSEYIIFQTVKGFEYPVCDVMVGFSRLCTCARLSISEA